MPAMITCEPEMFQIVLSGRQSLAEEKRRAHHVDQNTWQRFPDRERRGREDAVPAGEPANALGAQRKGEESADHRGGDEEGAQRARPCVESAQPRKDEREDYERQTEIFSAAEHAHPSGWMSHSQTRSQRPALQLPPKPPGRLSQAGEVPGAHDISRVRPCHAVWIGRWRRSRRRTRGDGGGGDGGDGGHGTSFKNGDTEKRRLRSSWRSEPMPARPSAGPSNQPTPRGHKLRVTCRQLAPAGRRLIARRARAAASAADRRLPGVHSVSLRPSVSPFLKLVPLPPSTPSPETAILRIALRHLPTS